MSEQNNNQNDFTKDKIIVGRKYSHGKNLGVYIGVGEQVKPGVFINKNLALIEYGKQFIFSDGKSITIGPTCIGHLISQTASQWWWNKFKLIEE